MQNTTRNINNEDWNTKVRICLLYLALLASRTSLLRAETTRYTNPLKQKFRAKRLATESGPHIPLHTMLSLYLWRSCDHSRWPRSRRS
jgi:hypothetical protein